MTHYNIHRADDFSIKVGDDLELSYRPGRVELLRFGSVFVSIETHPGETLGNDPALVSGRYVSSVNASPQTTDAELSLALYASLQQARVEQRSAVIAPTSLAERATVLLGLRPLPSNELLGARVDIALRDLATRFEGDLAAPPALFLQEVVATVNSHVRRAFDQPESFFAAVGVGDVGREQYVYMMSQQHSYVRYTTRILGYCVAYSEDSAMRQHFAKHLSEEVNHEKIIEADLRYLGADVDYVVADFEPNVAAAQFALGELALVSHFHDPVLLMAAPLAAEGLTAHLDQGFIDSLNDIVRSWGFNEPTRATLFLSSHIDFDGGDDGHFESSMRALEPYVTDERSLRRFLSALHAQANSFLRIYTEGMIESALWS